MNNEQAQQMLLFIEVAELLSFSKAADRLQVSKGYLSQQVKHLEKQLATQLLIRTTRQVRLTAEGRIVLEQARKLQQLLAETQEHILHQQEKIHGEIRITAPTAFAERYLVDICHEFCQLYSGISFDFDVGNTNQDMVASNFDLAIRITNTPPENLVARHLTEVVYWCVAAPAYLAEHPAPQNPKELKDHNCITLSSWKKWVFFSDRFSQVLDVSGNLSYPQNSLLREAALRGSGLIRVPYYVVEEDVNQGRLVRVLDDYIAEPRLIYMLYPPRATQPLKLQVFTKFLASKFVDKLPK